MQKKVLYICIYATEKKPALGNHKPYVKNGFFPINFHHLPIV